MVKIRECPNCRQPIDEDTVFCVFCGAKVPDSVEPAFEGSEAKPKGKIVKCPNGHEFTDGELDYCPICGLPVGTAAKTSSTDYSGETWRCSCGSLNPLDAEFCQSCGKAKETIERPRKADAEVHIPAGMYAPTDDDLKPKKTRI